MPAFFGIFSRDGSALDNLEFEAVREGMGVVPNTGWQRLASGPVLLGQALAAGTSTGDELGNGGLITMADSRLDNREELARRLGCDSRSCDARIIHSAYLRWGERFVKQLLGDFAFALYDGRRLLLARDHLGIKTLFYYRDDRRLVFAVDPAGVLAHPSVSTEVSVRSVGRYLRQGELYSPRDTFYRRVSKLPPATLFSDKGARSEQLVYWEPRSAPRIHYEDTDDYVEQLRELMWEAVRTRLPTSGPAGAHLSGGLDSSAITALAARQLGGGHACLRTWSWMHPPRSEREAKSAEWVDALSVAARHDLHLQFTQLDMAALDRAIRSNPLAAGDSTNLFYEFRVRQQAREQGVKVMLSGWGGDQFISTPGLTRYGDSFFSRHCLSTLGELWEEARAAQHPLRRFGGLGLSRVVRPLRMAAALSPDSGTIHPGLSQFVLPHVQASAAGKIIEGPPFRGFRVRGGQIDQFRHGHLRNRVEAWAVAAARQGLEYRYPLLDKRIVEFALGLPPQLYWQQGKSRYIFRRALDGLVPNSLCQGGIKYEQQRVDEFVATVGDWLSTGAQDIARKPSSLIDTDALAAWLKTIPVRADRDVGRLGWVGLAALNSLQVLCLEG